MRKKPYTSAEFFSLITETLKSRNLLPEILDYYLPGSEKEYITSDEFDIIGRINFGCEGIYLDIFIEGYFNDSGKRSLYIGTFKTLYSSEEYYLSMATLMTRFVFAGRNFISSNEDDFIWTGKSVCFFYEDGSRGYGLIGNKDLSNIESAVSSERNRNVFKYYTVTDYVKRESQKYEL